MGFRLSDTIPSWGWFRFLRVIHIIVTSTTLALGCTTHIPQYVPRPLDQYEHRALDQGLAVAIEPQTKSTEVMKYFGADLLSRNVLPVFVLIKNQSPDTSFVIVPEGISLSDSASVSDSQEFDDQFDLTPGSKNSAKAAGVATGVGALVFLPVALAGMGAVLAFADSMSDAEEIKHNLVIKALRARTLSPNKTVSGFVYVTMPDGGIIPEHLSLRVEYQDLKRRQSRSLDLPFEWR
jgi:hypothetical protein